MAPILILYLPLCSLLPFLTLLPFTQGAFCSFILPFAHIPLLRYLLTFFDPHIPLNYPRPSDPCLSFLGTAVPRIPLINPLFLKCLSFRRPFFPPASRDSSSPGAVTALSQRPEAARRGRRRRGAAGSSRSPAAPGAVQSGGTWPLPVSLPGRRWPDRGRCPAHSALRSSRPAAAEVASAFPSRCPRRAMEKSSSCESLDSQPAAARPPSVDSLSR